MVVVTATCHHTKEVTVAQSTARSARDQIRFPPRPAPAANRDSPSSTSSPRPSSRTTVPSMQPSLAQAHLHSLDHPGPLPLPDPLRRPVLRRRRRSVPEVPLRPGAARRLHRDDQLLRGPATPARGARLGPGPTHRADRSINGKADLGSSTAGRSRSSTARPWSCPIPRRTRRRIPS